MKKIMLCLLCFMLIFPLSGCFDIKDLQSLNFASAIGIDYKNGKYYAYMQMVGFNNIAKVEGATQAPPVQMIGQGVGSTLDDALTQLIYTGQRYIYLRHMGAIILSKSAIQKGLLPIMDAITRNSDFTLSPWVFGTKGSIEEIFSISGFFNQSSLETILHRPSVNYDQQSNIKPKQLYELAREITEPHFTTYLPTLEVNDNHWIEDGKTKPTIAYNGAFFLQNQHYKGFYKLDQLRGLRWITKGAKQVVLPVPKRNPSVSVLIYPKVKYQEKNRTDQTFVNLVITGNGYISERVENKNINKISEEVDNEIKKEVEQFYQMGISHHTDFLNLEHTLYRNNYAGWKKVGDKEKLLHDIEVNIKLIHSSSNKNKSLDIEKID